MNLGLSSIKVVDENLKKDLKEELKAQGHFLTGALENSIESIISTGDKIVLELFAEEYIDPVNDGVPIEKIPFDSSNKTGAKTSKYIEGLKNYAKLRFGLSDDKEALSAAFAIAKTHEKQGMPTKGSYAFSGNGRRTKSLEVTIEEKGNQYEEVIEKSIDKEIDILFNNGSEVTVL